MRHGKSRDIRLRIWLALKRIFGVLGSSVIIFWLGEAMGPGDGLHKAKEGVLASRSAINRAPPYPLEVRVQKFVERLAAVLDETSLRLLPNLLDGLSVRTCDGIHEILAVVYCEPVQVERRPFSPSRSGKQVYADHSSLTRVVPGSMLSAMMQ